MNNKLLGALLLAVVLGGMAWKISNDKAPQTEVTRTALYAGLLDKLNDVARVELRSAKTQTTLKRDDDKWTIANRDNFPADPAAVKRLLLGLADLQIVEAKTSLPDSYGRIGVADPGDGSDSLEIDVYGSKDDKIVAVIVGHGRDNGQQSQRYVRRAGEAQSYLVNGKLDGTSDPITWLDARIADVDTARVQRIEITPGDGPQVVITKSKPKDNFFELQNVPAGKVARSKALVSSLGALLLDLRFNSVVSAARFSAAKPLRRSTVQTFDGLVAHIDEFEADGKTYARFDFSYDAALVQAGAAQDAAAAKQAAEPPPVPGTEAAQPAATAKESVEQEVARLKARTAPWAYELPDYKMRMLSKRLDDLVQAAGKDEVKSEGKGSATP
jgi:hypothetical protein